jgi:uncharacterized phiE125 gp8 family phage protein
MALRLVTAPAAEPLDLEFDAKPHLRVDFDDDDAYIGGLITAVREHIEKTEISSALITQTWELVLDNWPGVELRLPKPPLQSVTSIQYYDIDDNPAVTVDSSTYLVDADSWPGRICLRDGQSWPSVTLREIGGVVIRFVAGYGDADDVPAPIRQAMQLILSDWYENRENTLIMPGVGVLPPLPFAARQLLGSYRRRQF